MPNDLTRLIEDIKEHLLYAQELGIDRLDVELSEADMQQVAPRPADVPSPVVEVRTDEVRGEYERPEIKMPPTQPKARASRIGSLPSLKRRPPAKETMTETIAETAQTVQPVPASTAVSVEAPDAADARLEHANDTIEYIRNEIGDCTRCPLHAGRTQIVHTTGNFQTDLMFIGEAPGADEDEQGLPFVGRAGQLLTKIIESIGMTRDEVCIGNINRCRPPGNRKPEPNETATCRPYILREIAVIKPKVIVVLGATAAHNLLQVKTPITKLRGEFHDYFGVKVMPTFHPAYLLRDPHKKREVWDDMKKVRNFLES
jgi:uracil-DNA glycosylase family 4